MNIFYFLLLLTIHNFIKTDESPNFTFTFKDETNLASGSTVTSLVANYDSNQSQTLDNLNISFTPNNTITVTVPPILSKGGSSYNRVGVKSLIFKSGSSTTTNTINFDPNLKNNGSFTLKKDGSNYSAADIKENSSPAGEEKKPDNTKPEEKTNDSNKSDDNKKDEKKNDEKKSSDSEQTKRSFGSLTIHNTSKDQDLQIQSISLLYSYRDTDGSTKKDSFSISSKNPVTINKNSTGTIPLKIKLDKPELAYNGLKTISLSDNKNIDIKSEDITNTMYEISITYTNSTWGYEVPKKEADDTKTDKSAEKKDTSKPDQTLPNPTPAAQSPKNDTSSKDAFIQSLHNNQ